jgi:hypothetical protein
LIISGLALQIPYFHWSFKGFGIPCPCHVSTPTAKSRNAGILNTSGSRLIVARDRMSADALSTRIARFRKAFGRGLGHKPTILESAAILRAAQLSALAELAAADPGTSANDLVRLDNAAARARADMHAALAPKRKPEPTLEQYLASKHHVSAA